MAFLARLQIENALHRLGELAKQRGESLDLIAVGGAVMVLAYDARLATHDVDVVPRRPESMRLVRELARQVAEEFD